MSAADKALPFIGLLRVFVDELVEKRMDSADYIALAPHMLDGVSPNTERTGEIFPELDINALSPSNHW